MQDDSGNSVDQNKWIIFTYEEDSGHVDEPFTKVWAPACSKNCGVNLDEWVFTGTNCRNEYDEKKNILKAQNVIIYLVPECGVKDLLKKLEEG